LQCQAQPVVVAAAVVGEIKVRIIEVEVPGQLSLIRFALETTVLATLCVGKKLVRHVIRASAGIDGTMTFVSLTERLGRSCSHYCFQAGAVSLLADSCGGAGHRVPTMNRQL
jgi:hypothetical protein